jgi:hypothetical protein
MMHISSMYIVHEEDFNLKKYSDFGGGKKK